MLNDGQLRDLMPSETYARWLALKARYIGTNDQIERQRAMFAAGLLFGKAMDRLDMTMCKGVGARIAELAKQHRVKMTAPTATIEIDDLVEMLREVNQVALNNLPCLTKIVE